jgi:AraC family transcriptional regulator, transcriptional activator of pobA
MPHKIQSPNRFSVLKMDSIRQHSIVFNKSAHEIGEAVFTDRYFSVHSRRDYNCRHDIAASRRDYFKISLITAGPGHFRLGNHEYRIEPPVLMFINPTDLKTWMPDNDAEQDGYYCIFKEELFEDVPQDREEVLNHPMFAAGGNPVVNLTNAEARYFESIFTQLKLEFDSEDPFREEAIRIYIKLLMLKAKRQANTEAPAHIALNAPQMLTKRFLSLLEKQFPIQALHTQLELKTVKAFAAELHVHPIHLNASVKTATGKNASEHIKHRITLEAKLLLKHTDWQISEIADCLGFDAPGNFTQFFKKHTGQAPHLFRL